MKCQKGIGMEAGSEWGFIDWFEFFVVAVCFMTLAHRRLLSLWYAVEAPLPPEELLLLLSKASGWAALLSAYLMLRVDVLIMFGLIGWPIIFLVVAAGMLMLAGISSLVVYSGLWTRGKTCLLAFIANRSETLAGQLRMLRLRAVRK